MRALKRLSDNKPFSDRGAKLTHAERAARGLLFGGRVRCAICNHGMRVKPNDSGWAYTCYHTGARPEGEPSSQIAAHILDTFVWSLAVDCIKDPAFLEYHAEQTRAVAGPAALAESQRRLLADAERKRDQLMEHIEGLARDDDTLGDYQLRLHQNKALRAELEAALEASQAQVAAEEARRATLAAFRAYAASEAPTLDSKTPLERHEMLVAMGTIVYVQKPNNFDRVGVLFDVRRLPGAAAGGNLKGGGLEGALSTIGSLSAIDPFVMPRRRAAPGSSSTCS